MVKGWRRLYGVRLRSALTAAAVAGVAVSLASVIFILTAQASLVRNVDATAAQRADEVVAALKDNDDPDLEDTLRPGAGDRTEVQIIAASGAVIASSSAMANQPAITSSRPTPGHRTREQHTLPGTGDDPYRIQAVGVDTPGGRRVVAVAQSLSPVVDSREVMTRALAWGTPLVACIVGFATFIFVGRSLRPVEAIRQRVATITAEELNSRVPVPAVHDEVAALAQTMNAMLDRLESAVEAQRRFVADASHELRSPLATVQVGLDLLAATASPENGARQLHRLRAETERLGRLVSDLLLLARVDENGLALRHEDVDLDDLAYAERDRLRAQYPDLRIEARIAPVRIRGDVGRLERALRNLGDNATKQAKSAVTVAVWSDEHYAHLAVADDGPGIPVADRERVFERFVRLDDSRAREDGGSGLGLPISREIIAGHGGEITVVDRLADLDLAGGAVLHVRLPPLRPPV
jgi:signal transduction histidine kinase